MWVLWIKQDNSLLINSLLFGCGINYLTPSKILSGVSTIRLLGCPFWLSLQPHLSATICHLISSANSLGTLENQRHILHKASKLPAQWSSWYQSADFICLSGSPAFCLEMGHFPCPAWTAFAISLPILDRLSAKKARFLLFVRAKLYIPHLHLLWIMDFTGFQWIRQLSCVGQKQHS